MDMIVRIPVEAFGAIAAMCDAAGDVETGGILVGHYEAGGDIACVEAADPPPPDSEHGPTDFLRGVVGVRERLVEAWPAAYYLGDWHYHPADEVVPSPADFAAMRAIAADPKAQCVCPVMVIVGRARPDGTRAQRAWAFPGGDPVECSP